MSWEANMRPDLTAVALLSIVSIGKLDLINSQKINCESHFNFFIIHAADLLPSIT